MHAGTQHGCWNAKFSLCNQNLAFPYSSHAGYQHRYLCGSCLPASLHWQKTNGFCCTCRICHCSTSPTSCGPMPPFCMTCRTCFLPSQVRSWSAVTRSSSTRSSSPTCCGPSASYRHALFGLASFVYGPEALAFGPGLFVNCRWIDSL